MMWWTGIASFIYLDFFSSLNFATGSGNENYHHPAFESFLTNQNFTFSLDQLQTTIEWKPYVPKYLVDSLKEFYHMAHCAKVKAPAFYYKHENSSNWNDQDFELYVRKFSSSPSPTHHIWFITGGPGGSSSSVEGAIRVKLQNTAIYLLDHRGLGKSQKLCKLKDQQDCSLNPEKCFKSLNYDPKSVSLHNAALDYNFLTLSIKRISPEAKFYIYGSSYGGMLAYRSFQYHPNLYHGILLEAFIANFSLYNNGDIADYMIDSCVSDSTCTARFVDAPGINLRQSLQSLVEKIFVTRNRCISILKTAGQFTGFRLEAYIGYVVRRVMIKRQFQTLLLPFLYNIVNCINPVSITLFLNHLMRPDPSNNSLHPSDASKLNFLHNKLIRFSEYKNSDPKLRASCIKQGRISKQSFIDPCDMINDYDSDFEPFLYEPKGVESNNVQSDCTRIVVVSGKWDTQTPYDHALSEFEKIKTKEKYFFGADHMAHGVIDSDRSKLLKLELFIDFLYTGDDEAKVRKALDSENLARPNWKESYEDELGFNIWDFRIKELEMEWEWFYGTLAALSIIPVVTMIKLITDKPKPANSL